MQKIDDTLLTHPYGRDYTSFFNFLTDAQIADVQSGSPTIDLTSAFVTAIAATTTLFVPPGTYLGSLSIRKSGFMLYGLGSKVTTIRTPAGANVVATCELGDAVSGNGATAYERIDVSGITFDANYPNSSAPADDTHGWAFLTTKISKSFWRDVRAINGWVGCAGIEINSNYNLGDFYVENGGNSGGFKYPNFDINSSKYNNFRFVSKDGWIGSRLLDNCFGNQITGTVQNAARQACVLNDQTVNESYANEVHIAAVGGCADAGVSVGANFRNSQIFVSGEGLTGPTYHGIGVNSGLLAANVPTGNTVVVVSKSGQNQAALIEDNGTTFTINSYLDGLAGAAGNAYAVDVYGSNNIINAVIQDGAVFQVRGLVFRAGANDNTLNSLQLAGNATIVGQYGDSGLRNAFNRGASQGSDIASVAGAIDLPLLGSVFNLTGVASVTSINSASAHKGRTVTFITTSTGGFTDGNNLKLAGNFSGTADDTITLTCDGTNFYEVARSVN